MSFKTFVTAFLILIAHAAVPAAQTATGTISGVTLLNTRTQDDVNGLDNLGIRSQLLFTPTGSVAITVTGDQTRQRPEGFTQVVAGVAPTLRAANRQYEQIAASIGYVAPSFNAFDRVTDIDTPMRSYQDLGGASVNADWTIGRGRLTSTTAWRFWDWKPSNDRDFIGVPVTSISAAPSYQEQWTQEVRYSGVVSPRFNFVTGAFYFRQALDSDPSFKQEQGSAAFGQAEWTVSRRLRLLPGLRFNYDQKDVVFDQQVYGGLQTTDAALIALQRSILAPQSYTADVDDTNLSGQMTAAYRVTRAVNAYATYATGFKSIGLNLNGVPTDAADQPVLSAATVKPEDVRHVEIGLKTEPLPGVTANVTVYNTAIKDFQAQVVNAGVGVLRGYLANAEKVRVRGAEFDGSARVNKRLSFYGNAAYTDGRYMSFPDAPPPLEETGGPQFKDVSGSVLPGISKWAVSVGGEYIVPGNILARPGEFFGALDTSYRSSFSSSASASRYLIVDGYSLVNARVSFRWTDGWTLSVWSRNLLNRDYLELLSAAPGNTGLYVGQPGDPRTVGVTMRVTLKSS